MNYYNFALAKTRFSHATKLDDDHIAFPNAMRRLVNDAVNSSMMQCFSGLNIARGPKGMVGILLREPFSGAGDIGVFPVTSDTYFVHDPRFERFSCRSMRKQFHSFTYWHVKYAKPGGGFANYDLDVNPRSRYRRKLQQYTSADPSVANLDGFKVLYKPRLLSRLFWAGVPVPSRDRLLADRDLHVPLLPSIAMPDLPEAEICCRW